VEAAVLAVTMGVLLAFGLAGGRLVAAESAGDQAARGAARIASAQRDPATAHRAATTAAQRTLAGQHLACARLTVIVDTEKGKAVITGFCLIMENFDPPPRVKAMEMEVIPPGTHVNVYEAYDIMLKVREMADILLPLHEPKFASIDTIP
jgi:hypothetical protein